MCTIYLQLCKWCAHRWKVMWSGKNKRLPPDKCSVGEDSQHQRLETLLLGGQRRDLVRVEKAAVAGMLEDFLHICGRNALGLVQSPEDLVTFVHALGPELNFNGLDTCQVAAQLAAQQPDQQQPQVAKMGGSDTMWVSAMTICITYMSLQNALYHFALIRSTLKLSHYSTRSLQRQITSWTVHLMLAPLLYKSLTIDFYRFACTSLLID